MTTPYQSTMASFIPRCAALLLGVFSSSTAWAQSDKQLWAVTSGTVKLSDKWRLSEEIVARFSDQRNGLYEVESNTLVGRVVGKGVTIWAGYTPTPNMLADISRSWSIAPASR